ncbi:hypothetical protein TrCOL_g168 [Triparma columacea]|uniref:Uncharacterized protein n=1 Tax=Triparma columacea TaxID=722753 RepID=A0A9W7LEV7_9STRA|nr:hypothetical protein TrCOL_g168 [Triparma columacea]
MFATRAITRISPRLQLAQKRFMGGQHDTFEPPFSPVFVGSIAVGILVTGVGVIWGGAVFQNKKHGFPQK